MGDPCMTTDDIRLLLELFAKPKSRDNERRIEEIQQTCVRLFAKDYPDSLVIGNENGELASTYPTKIIIPQETCPADTNGSGETGNVSTTSSSSSPCSMSTTNSVKKTTAMTHAHTHANGKKVSKIDANKLKDLMSRARVARCRARFPVPIFIYNGKYVCRSSTLSGGPEIYGRSGLDYLFTTNSEVENVSDNQSVGHNRTQTPPSPSPSTSATDSNHLFSRVRNQDIKLLKYLSVGNICDLMVEKKKVKFGVNVTSSEKADKESRYSDFNIMSLPYPGCEFFRDFRDNSYSAEGLIYDWNQHFVDAHLIIPNNDRICDSLHIDWRLYRAWDVITLTQNYLKLLLLYLHQSESSMLIHCISGWDRTPLFMTLMRLSLWADGKIHRSLSPLEMIFLTLAYDWFLFGHNLSDRLNKGEEILMFCFYFLKYMTSEEFNIDHLNVAHLKERKVSADVLMGCDEILFEEAIWGHRGSSNSLNSSCSSTSNRSQDPPKYFPVLSNEENAFHHSKFDSSGKTPPTLTNSEEGSAIFESDMSSTITDSSTATICGSPCQQSNSSNKSVLNGFNKMTEPVAIPSLKKLANCDATSPTLSRSNSWQLVSDTGSIRDFNWSKNSFNSPDSLSSPKSNVDNSHSSSSGELKRSPQINKLRKNRPEKERTVKSERFEKLQAVRSIFYNAYSAAIGFRFKNGSEAPATVTAISTLIDHFAGTVGIYSNRITSPH